MILTCCQMKPLQVAQEQAQVGTSSGGGGGLVPMENNTEKELTNLEKKMKSFFENIQKLIEPTKKHLKNCGMAVLHYLEILHGLH